MAISPRLRTKKVTPPPLSPLWFPEQCGVAVHALKTNRTGSLDRSNHLRGAAMSGYDRAEARDVRLCRQSRNISGGPQVAQHPRTVRGAYI